MSYQSRVILPPGASRKRKERDAFYSSKPLNPLHEVGPTTTSYGPTSNNKLLAGYLACEFLTKGTLLGQKFDPARAESKTTTKPFGAKLEAEPSLEMKPQSQRFYYRDVASLLRGDGAHIPGIVNPTQLDRWIQM